MTSARILRLCAAHLLATSAAAASPHAAAAAAHLQAAAPRSCTVAPRRRRATPCAALAFALAFVCTLLLCAAGSPGAARASGSTLIVKVSPASFSPNGDKVKDATTVTVRLSRAGKLTLGVYGPDGKLAAVLQKERQTAAGTRTYRWKGLAAGTAMANGRYSIRARFKSGGRTTNARGAVILDTVAPSIEFGDQTPTRLFAAADSLFPYVAGETPTRVELQVFTVGGRDGSGGKRVARAAATRLKKKGSVAWAGTRSGRALLAAGQYKVRLQAADAAGNAAVCHFEPLSVWSPRAVVGTVKDAAGKPIAGALVKVSGTRLATVSKADGSFAFSRCPMGIRVFTASKKGKAVAGRRLSVNLDTKRVDLVPGKPGRSETRWFWEDDHPTVTISGHYYFQNADGATYTPLRDVRVLLQDDATTFWDDLEDTETRTDENGFFSIRYDPDDFWDIWGHADIRVAAYAEDGGEEVCAVYWDESSAWPYEFGPDSAWEDNTSSHTGLSYGATGGDRVAFFIVDNMQRAHDRWREWTGWDRSSVDVCFPEDLGASSGTYSPMFDSIDLNDDGDEWIATTSYHEYGHALHREAYDVAGPATSIYDAYSLHGYATYVPSKGRTYSYADGDFSLEGEGNAWKDFKEGFAEYFAALNNDCDHGAMENTLERDVDHAGIDDAVCSHSVSRVLWDLTDDAETRLYSSWNRFKNADGSDNFSKCGPVDRPYGIYGTGDDDRLHGWGSEPFGATFEKVWSVLHYDWPANLRELRDYLFARYPKERLARRSLEAALYRMGIDPTAITETRPVVEAGSLVIRDADGADGPYREAVQLWCRVIDPDDQYGESDMATMKVRFEYRYQAVDALSAWVPIDCALTPAASPPPGHSGSGWFQVAWDTRAPSPVLLIPDAEIELNTGLPKVYDYTPNTSRDAPMITAATTLGGSAKRDTNWVRAIAFDGLAESEPLESGAFAIDNSPNSFGQQGRADAIADYIYWDDDHVPAGDLNTITWKPFTYELFFTPSAAQAGRVFEYSLGYKNVDAGRGERCEIMWLQMLGDGRLWFVVNEGGSKPGNGTRHSVYSTTALQAGTRYHIAAQSGGPGGMKLFVNGHAEYGAGSNGAGYTACPEADESASTLYGGWFAVGVYSDFIAGKYSALGGYDEVRVSNTERYTVDFTPRTTPFTSDANKVLLDHLDGSTSGVTGPGGFTFETP